MTALSVLNKTGKGVLLNQRKEGDWGAPQDEGRWNFGKWENGSVEKIKNLLKIWATWILQESQTSLSTLGERLVKELEKACG